MKGFLGIVMVTAFTVCLLGGCVDTPQSQVKSASGVGRMSIKVPTNTKGRTTEQENIGQRLVEDNRPGSIKHLYVISAYSGQVVIYSTVKGKITSGGKRLHPTSIVVGASGDWKRPGFSSGVGDTVTGEVVQDDGTYGHSMDYLYWWDTKGVYHQHYVAGGQILHISSEPLAVKGIIINMELNQKPKDE